MDAIKEVVRKKYADIAVGEGCGCAPTCCSAGEADSARISGYEGLGEQVVPGSDLGLGCGIPTAHAALRPGEIVLDLGSGAGVDVFLAAQEVGPSGRVIGVDMTPEMIAKARKNAAQNGIANAEFRLGDIEALPVENAGVDVVISNCVINLAPDKQRVYREIHRVLKPGGRFVISDMVTQGEMPAEIRRDLEAWAGCVAGAMDREEYLRLVGEVGFDRIVVRAESTHGSPENAAYAIQSITLEGWKPVKGNS